MALPDALTALMAAVPGALPDHELMAGQRELARAKQAIERQEAAFAGELAFRSRRELGHSGLAARQGARSPERLLQELTGASRATSRRLVRVGGLLAEASTTAPESAAAPSEPWLLPVLTSDLPIEAIDVIRTGLGMPGVRVTPEQLTAAASQLAELGASMPVDELAALARSLRDDIDAEGVALREQEMRDLSYLRYHQNPDGMLYFSGRADPGRGARLVAAFEGSPRRTGPAFDSHSKSAGDLAHSDDPAKPAAGSAARPAGDAAQGDEFIPDERTTEQRALDTLIELIDVAVRHPNTTILGHRRPAVRLLVTVQDLETRTGFGYVEGSTERVSINTIERHICDREVQPILFDPDGQAMDVGREQRLHTSKQREAITARDGGCFIPGCDKPPSRTEIHHIIPWFEHGNTSVEDGVCLCRYHHMMIHNNNWRITRTGADYYLIPPPTIDPDQVPRPIPKSAPVRRLLSQAG